jgi:hypothetical protein
MTVGQLVVELVDIFHDWIDDCEDWVVKVDGHNPNPHDGFVDVEFASGRQFTIAIQPL